MTEVPCEICCSLKTTTLFHSTFDPSPSMSLKPKDGLLINSLISFGPCPTLIDFIAILLNPTFWLNCSLRQYQRHERERTLFWSRQFWVDHSTTRRLT